MKSPFKQKIIAPAHGRRMGAAQRNDRGRESGIGKWLRLVAEILLYGLAILFLSVMQTRFCTRFRILGASPDLLLAFVMALAYFKDNKTAVLVGLPAGFLVDALAGSRLSLLCLFYPLSALFLGSDETGEGRGYPFGRFVLTSLLSCGMKIPLSCLYAYFGGGISKIILSEFLLTLPIMLLFGLIGLIDFSGIGRRKSE